MSLYTRLKIWAAGEILTAADLNTEFDNDLINGPPNHASQHAASGVDDIKAYYLSLSAGGTVAAAVTFSAAAPITLTSKLNEYKGSDIASAATTDIGAAGGNFVDVTGTATITALGTIQAGTERIVRFTSTPTLTHNGTSLILPGGANIVCQANDIAMFRSLGAGNWVCTSYQRAVNPPYVQSATPAANTVPVSGSTGELTGWGINTWSSYWNYSVGATLTYYASLGGYVNANTQSATKLLMATAGSVKKLYVQALANTLDGSAVITLQKNGVDTAMTITITAGSVALFSNTTDVVTFSIGDYLGLKVAAGGSSGQLGSGVYFGVTLNGI